MHMDTRRFLRCRAGCVGLVSNLLLTHTLTQVQLQLLTATVKLFLKAPTEGAQKMISLVLSCATNETDNPDLRDRAYIYWRLLSTDPEVRASVSVHVDVSSVCYLGWCVWGGRGSAQKIISLAPPKRPSTPT